ncbi:MAG: type IX secretion system protein PorQ [Ekhidna sp.]|nr:type IX secretion system protein PorQ [Ekhidna sp.]
MRFIFGILLLNPFLGLAQLGGEFGYQSLHISPNPRSAALGGATTISLSDGDISQFFMNPATLDSVRAGDIFFHLNPYFADAFFYSFGYAFHLKGLENFAIGLQYLNFGSFDLTDAAGQELGSFNASDYGFFISKAHQAGPITLGATLKFFHSMIDNYSSHLLAMDLGGVFRLNPNWAFAMVFENMGMTLTDYSNNSDSSLPFDVKLGTSFKPKYMPVQFTITSNNLVSTNLTRPVEENGRSNETINKALKRINFGIEFLLSKNFHFLAGYNHKRRQELTLDEAGGGAGLSYGIMLKIKRFQMRFSRAAYHSAGGTNFISIQTNLKDFKKIL